MAETPFAASGYSFTIGCAHAQGLTGHLFITFADYVNLLVFFGFDQFFRTLCMIVPFCGLVYNDLQAWHALRGDFDYTWCYLKNKFVYILRSPEAGKRGKELKSLIFM
jgi:hypothetical protein